MREISWVSEDLLTSQDSLCSVELIISTEQAGVVSTVRSLFETYSHRISEMSWLRSQHVRVDAAEAPYVQARRGA